MGPMGRYFALDQLPQKTKLLWQFIRPVRLAAQLTPKQNFHVPASAQYAENDYVRVLRAIDDDVLPTEKLRKPGRKSWSRARPMLG